MGFVMIERLIDSVILIDHLNGVTEATRFIVALNPLQTAISVITRAEILAGLDEEGQAAVTSLLDQYQLLIIDKPIADLAAQLRRKYGWKLPDAFQAALAQHHKTRLTTRNTKDFDPEKHDFVEIPYTL
jgi:predicted nucleic acid-binding protein